METVQTETPSMIYIDSYGSGYFKIFLKGVDSRVFEDLGLILPGSIQKKVYKDDPDTRLFPARPGKKAGYVVVRIPSDSEFERLNSEIIEQLKKILQDFLKLPDNKEWI